jgi:hypothetical protein
MKVKSFMSEGVIAKDNIQQAVLIQSPALHL